MLASKVASKAAFNAGGRVVSQRQCNLSPEAVEAEVCLKNWKIADRRLYDSFREVTLESDMENLKLLRYESMHGSSPSPPRNDE